MTLALLLIACTSTPSVPGGTLTGIGTDGGATGTSHATDTGIHGTTTSTQDAGTQDTGNGTATDTGATTPLADRSCELSADLADPNFTEGDTVSFSVACTGSLLTKDAQVVATTIPDGATFDADSLVLSWETGPADGGRFDMVFSTRPTDELNTIPTATAITVWVADNPLLPDAVAVDPAAYTEEWGLPVIHIQTTTTLSQTDQPATLTWYGVALDGLIRIHGAASASYAKTSYRLKFPDTEIDLPAWGVTRDHLILIASFDDNSYVRQKLIYDQWAAIADYWGLDRSTPRTFFVVVYLDGAYHGLYLAIDRIDNEFVRQMGFDDSGNLYKAINHDANFYLTNSSGSAKDTLHDGYEKEEGLPQDDFTDLDALVAFTGSSSTTDLIDQADNWVRLDEFMDWFLLIYYGQATDSAGKNAYLYHDPSSDRFVYTPWDFNASWGQSWYTLRLSSSELYSQTSYNKVFASILADPTASTALWARFSAMREDGPYSLAWMQAMLDGYFALIDPSAQRDWDTWGPMYRREWWAPYRNGDWTTYDQEKEYVRTWIEERDALFWELVP
ncbi:MAG: hypothetical protein GXP62_22075 [Oligoflexia bacterium]|nr:hypothetical protein [Oligoflexia bacterium]